MLKAVLKKWIQFYAIGEKLEIFRQTRPKTQRMRRAGDDDTY
jgi:hypothetical protein